ncbi:kinase-like domain-containing protein [Entophlyctis helioformis]|nr:kinase-like domain-containing protein [Entophlyctis helioformis]
MSRPAQGNAAQGNGSSQRRTSNGGSYANGTGYGYGSPNGYNGRQQQQQHQQQHQQQQRNSSSAAAYYPTPTPPPSTPSSPPPSAPLPGRVGYSGAGAGAAGHSGSGASTYAQQQYQYAQQPQYYPQPYGSTPPPSSPYAGAQQHPQAAGRPAGGHHHGHHGNHKYSLFGPYRLGKTIGEGEFGKVKLAYHSESGKEVAIKLIKKESIDSSSRRDKLIREIRILKSLDHPYIVKLLEVIETEHYIGMIMEYVSGGELFEHILARSYLKEKEAATFFAQLIAGISYLHKNHIVHRDLKLENLLLDHKKNIIITDFGFANTAPTDVNALMLTSCGSPCYAAPELVINDGYVGEAADIWSCGVILYAMLCGYLPFDDDPANPASENLNLLYKYILETELEFPDYVPVGARALLRRILVPDPKKRANMAEIKAHFWLRPYAHIFENDPAADNIESVAAPAAAGVPIVVSNVITRDVSFTTSRTGELQVVVTTESTVVETTTIPVPDVAITPSPAPSTKVSDESLTATSGGRRAVKFTVSDTESDVFATARADPVKSRGKSLDVRRMQTPDSDDNDSDAVVPSSASAKSGKTKSGKSAAVAAARRKSENQSKAPLVPSKAAAAKSSKTTSMAPRPSVSSTLSGSQVVPDMARLKPHNGPIDQRALSSKAPRELLAEVSAVLEQMGMEVSVAEGEEFKLRVVRPKAGSDHHHHRTALSAQSSTETLQSAAAGIADAMEAQTRPSIRFHVSLHRIKNLPGLLVVDFKRLRGDIWEFKRLYHDVVAKLPLQDNSEYQI